MTEGETEIVTGATSGTGKETALIYARKGAGVVVAGRNETRGSEVVDVIKTNSGNAVFVKTNITKEDVINLIECAKKCEKIDILVNVAGINYSRTLDDLTVGGWDDTMNTNVRSIFLTTKCAMPELIKVICLGMIKTRLVAGLMNDEGFMNRVRKRPFGRVGQSEEIASLTLFLSSDDSASIYGDSILCDGGWCIRN